MQLLCFNLLFLLMHKLTHIWAAQTNWCLSPLNAILVVSERYLSVWHNKIFQAYLLHFLLINQNFRGKYKPLKTIFLTQNGQAELQWFFVVLPFAGQTLRGIGSEWVYTTQKHRYLSPPRPSLTWCWNLVWVTLPALGCAISVLNNYFLTMGFSSKDVSLQEERIHYTYPAL